jgi:hypothetical protein
VDDEAAEPRGAEAHPCQKNFDPRQQIPVHASRLALPCSRYVPYFATSAVGNPL